MKAAAFLAGRSFNARERQPCPITRRTFDQSAIYRAEAEAIAAFKALHGSQHEPSAMDVREAAMRLLDKEQP